MRLSHSRVRAHECTHVRSSTAVAPVVSKLLPSISLMMTAGLYPIVLGKQKS